MATIPQTGNRKCWRVIDVRDMTTIAERLTQRQAFAQSGHNFQACRQGFRLVACDGVAHSNAHIDNCGLCAPRWGWVEIPEAFATLDAYRASRCDCATIGDCPICAPDPNETGDE